MVHGRAIGLRAIAIFDAPATGLYRDAHSRILGPSTRRIRPAYAVDRVPGSGHDDGHLHSGAPVLRPLARVGARAATRRHAVPADDRELGDERLARRTLKVEGT